jgi:bifunctional non-homologous end joining protein LigD
MGKNDFPRHYLPMVASTAKHPFNDPEWQYEVKWDGYRMLAYVEKGKVELRSRNDKDYTKRFHIIADELTR